VNRVRAREVRCSDARDTGCRYATARQVEIGVLAVVLMVLVLVDGPFHHRLLVRVAAMAEALRCCGRLMRQGMRLLGDAQMPMRILARIMLMLDAAVRHMGMDVAAMGIVVRHVTIRVVDSMAAVRVMMHHGPVIVVGDIHNVMAVRMQVVRPTMGHVMAVVADRATVMVVVRHSAIGVVDRMTAMGMMMHNPPIRMVRCVHDMMAMRVFMRSAAVGIAIRPLGRCPHAWRFVFRRASGEGWMSR
jgi:hypothetical protein